MPLREPHSGLVIGYAYLLHREFLDGEEDGRKDFPGAVVLAQRQEEGDIVTTVAPITHVAPQDPAIALQISAPITAALGLDAAPCWLICNEVNRFVWPDPDLRPIAHTTAGRFVYGMLPHWFMRQVFRRLLQLRTAPRPRVKIRMPRLLTATLPPAR